MYLRLYGDCMAHCVADPGCFSGSRILNFTHPGSQIQKQQQKRGVKKNLMLYLFCSHTFQKIKNYFILKCCRKKFGPIFKELLKFLPKKLSLSSQKYGFGLRYLRSGKNLFRIPDPGVKKAPDHGSQIHNTAGTSTKRLPNPSSTI